ncbi:alanine dehydrogenase [Desulfobotulus sp. H1]|uniref:Alanine dehydrogenase n=1 Tax=Desulfobotulus pelophilus TaxID=2823377 RepID=A0ABT3N571_9BACT|nr:alanine dehydrogenase [Desulfobotulus pelophilus]MCW7752602.1 alanine dehydrogenase [Desulfobotulus pelophilus]
MIVGILKEIKHQENRVAMTPAGVEIMVANGHSVLVEKNAGAASGFDDESYAGAGARLVGNPADIFADAEMVMHVKEPQPSEYDLIREDQIVFTYFHFAAYEQLTHAFIRTRGIALAYETIEDNNGGLPLLIPMSEVAGRMAVQEAARYLERTHGGRGILLGGVTGVPPARVLVLGGGTVGTNAALMACGLGAQVDLIDTRLDRLRYLSATMPKNCVPIMSSPAIIRQKVSEADVIIGAVLLPGAKTPKLITREMVKTMKTGSVIVDVAIDQGGCIETSRPTTHDDPVYEIDGVLHYCVSNMPGAVPMTSTIALTNATLPYALAIASNGLLEAVREFPEMQKGLNIVRGHVTCKGVAEAFDLDYTPVEKSFYE